MIGAAEVVRRWVELYNDGTPDAYGSDRFLELYAEDLDWRERPNPFRTSGRSGNKETLREALRAGQAVFRDRRVVLEDVLCDAEDRRAAFRYRWSARVGVDTPTWPAGTVLELSVAQFIEVRDGLIVCSMEYAVPAA